MGHDRVLRVRLRVEHQLQGLIVWEVATRIIYIWIQLEIPTAQLREVSDLCRLQPLLILVRMLGVRVQFETLTLNHFPSLLVLICRRISGYRPLVQGGALPVVNVQLIPIVRQLRATLESVPARFIVDAVHSVFGDVLLHILLRYGVPRREDSVLDLGLRVSIE